MMKKLIFLMLGLFPLLAIAQTDTAKVKKYGEYCEFYAAGKAFSRKVTIMVDYGQDLKHYQEVTDENGNAIDFYSAIDGLNYMSRNGWYLVNAYSITDRNSSQTYYVMRRTAK